MRHPRPGPPPPGEYLLDANGSTSVSLVFDLVRRLLRRPPSLGKLYGREQHIADHVNQELNARLGRGADPFTFWRHKVALLQQRVTAKANEWTYHYLLCFAAIELAEITVALEAAEAMVALRPQDPRSTSALGTVYGFLATVASVNDDELFSLLLLLPSSFDRQELARVLASLDLTMDAAALHAYDWFVRTQALSVSSHDRKMLDLNIGSVLSLLPEATRPEHHYSL